MVVEKLREVNPPSGRVPGRGLLVLPILEARRWRNKGENRDAGVKIGQRGAPGGGPTSQAPWWSNQGGGCARWPPGWALVPLRHSFGDLEASVLLIFYLIFLEYLELCKYG